TMPLSMNVPFLTERAITWFSDPSGSSSAFACCCASCNHASVDPTESRGFVRPKSYPRRHHAGGPQDSLPHHEPSGAILSNATGRPYRAKRFHARCFQPGPPSLCKPEELAALHLTAYAIARN